MKIISQIFVCLSLRPSATLREKIRIMEPNEITGQVVNEAFNNHTQLGPGLLEIVYERAWSRRGAEAAEKSKAVEDRGDFHDQSFKYLWLGLGKEQSDQPRPFPPDPIYCQQ
jgi:hypothetical protein